MMEDSTTADIARAVASQLSEEELLGLKELKQHQSARGFTDKALAVFYFARKGRLDCAVELLEAHTRWRKDHEFEGPVAPERLNEQMISTCYSYMIRGMRDKQGRGIGYLYPAKMPFKSFPLKDHLAYLLRGWENCLEETLDFHRTGVTFVLDLTDMSLTQLDVRIMNAMLDAVQNRFPHRIGQVLIINPPRYLRTLLAFGRWFVKKKIMDRVKVITVEQLLEYICEDQLSVQYGGTVPFDSAKWLEELKGTRA